MFDEIEKKTGLGINEIIRIFEFYKGTNFQSEKETRILIKRISRIAKRPISKKTEDLIVSSIKSFQRDMKTNNLKK